MPEDSNQESAPPSQSNTIVQRLDSSPEDIREVFHDLLGIKRRLNKLKSFFKTRRRVKNGEYLFDFTANQIKESDLMGPLTFNIYSSTIAATIALVVTKVFRFLFPDQRPSIVYDANSVMGQFSNLGPQVEGYVRPFVIPVTFLFLAYLISWGTIRGTEPRIASISYNSLNKLLPSRIRGRNAFLYFDGAYGLIPQALLSLALSTFSSLPARYFLTGETVRPGVEFAVSRLILIDVLAATILGVGLICQGYLTYYKYPTLLFKAHGYYSPDSTTRFRPPWFKYIFTVIFLSPVVSISTYLLYRATVFIVSILLAIVLASLQPLVASNAVKQGSTAPATVATLNSNKESVSEEAFNPPLKWKNIDAGAVSFYAPPDLRENDPGKYQSRDILLEVDQLYNPDTTLAGVYDNNREFQLSRTKIDGRNGEIVSFYDDNRIEHPPGFNHYAILFVPHMSGQSGITVRTYSRSQDARVVAIRIFSTVRFAK